ncbi:hypothetical protein Fmac_024789 [Flemingia macrophylla]|uniref:DUF7745 domain-containing protein n=1 Tax=Flemingia macrophylla TaxID=520843 RepID=A0ABD1LQH8_9FABA
MSSCLDGPNQPGLEAKTLEDHLSSLADKGDWSTFNKTLALIVFGMTLFPFHADTIDHAAMDVFFAWDVYLKSPLPAIFADTLLSSHGGIARSFEKFLQNPSPLPLRYGMESQVGELEHRPFLMDLPLVSIQRRLDPVRELSKHTIDGP